MTRFALLRDLYLEARGGERGTKILNCNREKIKLYNQVLNAFNNALNSVVQERERAMLGEVTKSLLKRSRT